MIIFELVHDFNYTHSTDLLLTHYNEKNVNNKNNININRIYVNLKHYQIYNCNINTSHSIYFQKSTIIIN